MPSKLLTVIGIATLMAMGMIQLSPSSVEALDPVIGDFWQYDYQVSDTGGLEVIGTIIYSVERLETRTVGGLETSVYIMQMNTLGSISGYYSGLPVTGLLTGSGSAARLASDSSLLDERAVVNMDVVLAGFIHDSPSGGRIAAYDPPLGDFPVDQDLEMSLDMVSTSHATGVSWTEIMGSNETETIDEQVIVKTTILDDDVQVTTKAGTFSCYKLEIVRESGTENSTTVGFYSVAVGNFVKQEGGGMLQGFYGNVTLKSYRYSGPADKIPPIAEAGPGMMAARGTTVALDGTSSSDNVGIENYTWAYADNGFDFERYGDVVWVTLWEIGNHTIQLTVTDAAGLSASDTTWIEVVDAIDNPPTADAGPDMNVSYGEQFVLNGSGSSDDFGIVNYTWTVLEYQVELYGQTPTCSFTELGVFTVSLTVVDTSGQHSEPSTMNITVLDMTPPIADAGPNRRAAVGTLVVLDGSGSTDNVGIVNYTWTYYDNSEIHHLYGEVVTTSFMSIGSHAVELNVSDDAGFWSNDTAWIDILDIPDETPTADAGSDWTVAQGTVITLNGSGSHDDFGIVNYTWTIVSMSETLFGPSPQIVFTELGLISVELVVTDTIGQTSTPDTVNITVVDATPPIADAGADQFVDFGEVVVLNGSMSSDNVAVVSYSWSIDDGSPIVLEGIVVTHAFNSTGLHVVTLTVVDAAGLTDFDVLVVTVTDDTSPVARAGSDLSVFVGDLVTLDGSASTDNVGIVNYTWVITDDSEQTRFGQIVYFVADTEGVHSAVLTVRDAHGNLGQDEVKITVLKRSVSTTSGNPSYLAPIVAVVAVLGLIVVLLYRFMKNRASGGKNSYLSNKGRPPRSE